MALVNHAKREINAKIVYFGPAGSGKSTALKYIFSRIKPSLRGELKKVPTGGDSLLFFDFSPFDAPLPDGYRVRLHVYTLTGPVANPATWKMTLKGADGLIIMADASPERFFDVQNSVAQLRDLLSAYGVGLHDTPAVLQMNSFRQEQSAMSCEQFATAANLAGLPCRLSCVASGEGVLEALTTLSRLVLDRVDAQYKRRDDRAREPVAPDSEDIDDASGEALPGVPGLLTGVSDARIQAESALPVTLVCQGVSVEGTTVRIPLEVSCGGSRRKLIIKVSVDPEQVSCSTE